MDPGAVEKFSAEARTERPPFTTVPHHESCMCACCMYICMFISIVKHSMCGAQE
jgi:hypothetical protein